MINFIKIFKINPKRETFFFFNNEIERSKMNLHIVIKLREAKLL